MPPESDDIQAFTAQATDWFNAIANRDVERLLYFASPAYSHIGPMLSDPNDDLHVWFLSDRSPAYQSARIADGKLEVMYATQAVRSKRSWACRYNPRIHQPKSNAERLELPLMTQNKHLWCQLFYYMDGRWRANYELEGQRMGEPYVDPYF